jgi:hypothetical protein
MFFSINTPNQIFSFVTQIKIDQKIIRNNWPNYYLVTHIMVDTIYYKIRQDSYQKVREYFSKWLSSADLTRGGKKIQLLNLMSFAEQDNCNSQSDTNDYINILFYCENWIEIYVRDIKQFIDFLIKHHIEGYFNNFVDILSTLIDMNDMNSLDHLLNIYHNSVYEDEHDKLNGTLGRACMSSNLDIIQCLLTNIDYTDEKKNFALSIACERGDMEIIDMLLNELDYRIINFPLAICFAIKSQNVKIVDLIMIHCEQKIILADNDYLKNFFLKEAIENNSVDIVEYFLKKGAELRIPRVCDIEDMVDSMKQNHMEIIEYLLNNLPYEQKFIDTMFINSADCSVEMVEILINAGANAKQYGKRLCSLAEAENNHHLIEFLKTTIVLKNKRDMVIQLLELSWKCKCVDEHNHELILDRINELDNVGMLAEISNMLIKSAYFGKQMDDETIENGLKHLEEMNKMFDEKK